MADNITLYVDSEDTTVVRSHDDVCEMFTDMLNELYRPVMLGGVNYDYSQVWRATDPIAYRQAELEYFEGYTEVKVPWQTWVDDDAEAIEACVAGQVG